MFDFNWIVRKYLAQNLPKIKVDQAHFLNELLQDEEREVVQATGVALAQFIIDGNFQWLERYLQLVKTLPATDVIKSLP